MTTNPGFGYQIIVDRHGTPVWWYRQLHNQPLDGKVLAAGTLLWSDGSRYTRRRLDGTEVAAIGTRLDSHDLIETPTGYLGMRYVPRNCPAVPTDCVDLSGWGGGTSANPTYAEVVEFDRAGNVLWTWDSRQHIAVSEATEFFSLNGVGPFSQANDIVHINSFELDASTATSWPNSGFMISSRHLDAVHHIARATGEVTWKLGGTPTPESLTVTNPPPGSPLMVGIHDVRLLPDGTVTLHDNGTGAKRGPRAMRFSLDLVKRTATLVEMLERSSSPQLVLLWFVPSPARW